MKLYYVSILTMIFIVGLGKESIGQTDSLILGEWNLHRAWIPFSMDEKINIPDEDSINIVFFKMKVYKLRIGAYEESGSWKLKRKGKKIKLSKMKNNWKNLRSEKYKCKDWEYYSLRSEVKFPIIHMTKTDAIFYTTLVIKCDRVTANYVFVREGEKSKLTW